MSSRVFHFDEFLKRYKKTGYVSTSNAKKLKQFGLDKSIDQISQDVVSSYKFLIEQYHNREENDLKDTIDYILEDTNLVASGYKCQWCYALENRNTSSSYESVLPMFYLFTKTNYIERGSYSMEYKHHPPGAMVGQMLTDVNNMKISKLKRLEYDDTTTDKWKKSWNKYQHSKLSKFKEFEHMRVNPCLKIELTTRTSWKDIDDVKRAFQTGFYRYLLTVGYDCNYRVEMRGSEYIIYIDLNK